MTVRLTLDIGARRPFAEGASFADSGPYELLSGRVRFAVDPAAAAYRQVVDIDRAARDADGRIAFRAAPEAPPATPGSGTVMLAVAPPETPVAPKPPVAPEPATAPAHARPQPAAVPAQAVGNAAMPDPASPVTNAYESALRKLRERQGAGSVRSVSALTRVHPAVDVFRNLTR